MTSFAQENTFTITITGPEGQTAAQERERANARQAARPAVRPVQRPQAQAAAQTAPAAPAAQAQTQPAPTATQATAPLVIQTQANTAAATPPAAQRPTGTVYRVNPQDTIWSIASRFTMPDGGTNEFQAVAAIYRNNPDAFVNGNVNNLRMGQITIPPASEIARENANTGAELLRQGRMTLPALPAAPRAVNNQTAALPAAAPAVTAEPAITEPVKSIDNTKADRFDIPVYVARETQMKQKEADRDDPVKSFYNDDDGSLGDTEGKTVNQKNDPATQKIDLSEFKDARPLAATDLDIAAVKNMLETTQQQFVHANQQLDKKIDQSVLRAETVAKSSASSIAKEEVVKALSHYEGVIANLQQSNAELRASISKFNKQIDQVRAIAISNSDNLSQLQTQYIGMTEGGDDSIPQGPLMWILLGVGLLCLVLAGSFFVLKSKKSDTDDTSDDFGPYDDLTSDVLLTSTIINKQSLKDEAPAEEPPANYDDGVTSTRERTERDPNLNKVEASKQSQKDSFDDQLIVPSDFDADDDDDDSANSSLSAQEREAQKAWEDAAKKKAVESASKKKLASPSEDDVMAAWSATLDKASDDRSTVVDIEGDTPSKLIDNTSEADSTESNQPEAEVSDDKISSQEQDASGAWEGAVNDSSAIDDSAAKSNISLDTDNSARSDADTDIKADIFRQDTDEDDILTVSSDSVDKKDDIVQVSQESEYDRLMDDEESDNHDSVLIDTSSGEKIPGSEDIQAVTDEQEQSVRGEGESAEEKALADAWASALDRSDDNSSEEADTNKDNLSSSGLQKDIDNGLSDTADSDEIIISSLDDLSPASSDVKSMSEQERSLIDAMNKVSDLKDDTVSLDDIAALDEDDSDEPLSAKSEENDELQDKLSSYFEDIAKDEQDRDLSDNADDTDDTDDTDNADDTDDADNTDYADEAQSQNLYAKDVVLDRHDYSTDSVSDIGDDPVKSQDTDLTDDSKETDVGQRLTELQKQMEQMVHGAYSAENASSLNSQSDFKGDTGSVSDFTDDDGDDDFDDLVVSGDDIGDIDEDLHEKSTDAQSDINDEMSSLDGVISVNADEHGIRAGTSVDDVLNALDNEPSQIENDNTDDIIKAGTNVDELLSAFDTDPKSDSASDNKELPSGLNVDEALSSLESSNIDDHIVSDGNTQDDLSEGDSIDDAVDLTSVEDAEDLHKALTGEDESVQQEMPLEARALENSINNTHEKVPVIGDDIDFSSLLDESNINAATDTEHRIEEDGADAKVKDDMALSDAVTEPDSNEDEAADKNPDFNDSKGDDDVSLNEEQKVENTDAEKDDSHNIFDDLIEPDSDAGSALNDNEAKADEGISEVDGTLSESASYLKDEDVALKDKGPEVSWEVPDGDYDVPGSAGPGGQKGGDAIEQAIAADRDMLESMLSGEQDAAIDGKEILSADGFSAADLTNMLKQDDDISDLPSAQSDSADSDINADDYVSDFPDSSDSKESNDSNESTDSHGDNELGSDVIVDDSDDEVDSFDKRLQTSSLSEHFDDDTGEIDRAVSDNTTIDSRLHQKLTDELNLAQLFFETGDTDEALAIVDKVKEKGSADLIQIAEDLKNRYADN